jgi:predicted NUDIX family NTP pyrophosphohydrolase
MEWPAKSGRTQEFPKVHHDGWLKIAKVQKWIIAWDLLSRMLRLISKASFGFSDFLLAPTRYL